MSRLAELVAEIRSQFSKYDAAGLIDDVSVTRDIVKGLKRFGNDITTMQETIVEVKDGRAKLPENFYNLYVAFSCTPAHYTSKKEDKILMSSSIHRERTTNTDVWSECDTCCQEKKDSFIREEVYMDGGYSNYYYKSPTILSLGKNKNQSAYHGKCRNKLVRDNPNTITIDGITLHANFNGSIYLQYYGLPTDEDGFIDIPETSTGHLETYLEYMVKRRLAETLIANNDSTSLSSMYGNYAQRESIALGNATSELKMQHLTVGSFKRIAVKNRLATMQYEIHTNYQWQ